MTPQRDTHSYRVIVSDDVLPALVGHTGAQYESPPQDERAALALVRLLLGFPGLPDGQGPWCSAMPGGQRTIHLQAVQRP
jgi:hypothetical protein